jgi:hypothetical protein
MLIRLRPRSDSIASEFSDLIETVCFGQELRRNVYLRNNIIKAHP